MHRGPAAWSAILPVQPAPMPLPLSGDQTFDVAIIGEGFAGLAKGASGRNSGLMTDLPQ